MNTPKAFYQNPYNLTFASVEYFADQLISGWSLAKRIKLMKPTDVDRVLLCGMGGSALGADILGSALEQQLKKPLLIVNDYQLPAWADKRTLVVCASYSGQTIETITCFKQALKKRLPLVVISKDGRLVRLAAKAKVAIVRIDDKIFNPSQQPRLGLGFQLGALLAILSKSGAVKISSELIEDISCKLGKIKNHASEVIIKQLKQRIVIVLGVGYLRGAAHAIANQFNENAKVVAAPFGLPEADHHFLEGLAQIRRLRLPTTAIVLAPNELNKDLRRQIMVTITVLKKQGLKVIKWQAKAGQSSLVASLAAAQWGAYLSLVVAKNTRINPLIIPWVDFLKRQLK